MSFFDKPANMVAITVVFLVIELLGVILLVPNAFMAGSFDTKVMYFGIESLLVAFVYLMLLRTVRGEILKDGFFAHLVLVAGMVYVFEGAVSVLQGSATGVPETLYGGAIAVLIGLLTAFIGKRVLDDTGRFSKILWAVLLIIFVVGFLESTAEFFTPMSGILVVNAMNMLSAAGGFVLSIVMLLFLIDPDVRAMTKK